jgi:adenosine deaminase
MLKAFLREQAADDVGYVEVRVSPDRWLRDGMELHEFLSTVDDILGASDRPIARAVVLVNRRATAAEVAVLQAALAACPVRAVVGVDLAGDERSHPDVRPFAAFFEWARRVGLGITIHAGEFGGSRNIWKALDELGAQRIGHGLAAAGEAALTRRLAVDQTLVEVSVSANLALGAWDAVGLHPAATLLEAGVPLCFNSDVPLHTGASLRSEIVTAAVALGVGRARILEMQTRAWGHTFERRSLPRTDRSD